MKRTFFLLAVAAARENRMASLSVALDGIMRVVWASRVIGLGIDSFSPRH
jgi:hypothetical protein